MADPDFSKIFATNGSVSAPSDTNYLLGLSFLGSSPPTEELFNFLFQNNDLKFKYLHDNMPDGSNYLAKAGGSMTGAINEAYATVASAATTADIWSAAGNTINFTGTETITDFPDAPQAGARRRLICASTPTFTNNSNISVQGGANYTAAAGDIVDVEAITTSTFKATIYKADGKAVVASGGGLVGDARNLVITVTSNTQLTLAADNVVLSDGTIVKSFGAISATISTGTIGANGLDTGTVAVSTWYYVHAISNGATLAGLLSLSATAPTLPSGYTYAGYFGAVRTNSSGYLTKTKQIGKLTAYINSSGLPQMLAASTGTGNTVTPTWTAVSVSNFVPPTAATVIGSIVNGGAYMAMVAPNNSYGPRNSGSNPPPMVTYYSGGNYNTSHLFRFLLESTNIYAAADGNCVIYCYGWEEK